MPRFSPDVANAENDNAMNVDNEEKVEGSAGDGEEEGSEYEIEEIMDAKRGAFPEGRMGYLVKWKGYGLEDNSWVDEQDTENAKELVAEFWRKNPKKKPRKSVEPKASKRGRKSLATEEESDTGSAAKKRGRKPAADVESEEEDEATARNKKTRKAEKPPGRQRKGEDASLVMDMGKYMDKDSWEDLVDTVDTVEKGNDGLQVYFTLKNGEQIRESSDLCRSRFPQKLLNFYENNLKWRVAEAGDDE